MMQSVFFPETCSLIVRLNSFSPPEEVVGLSQELAMLISRSFHVTIFSARLSRRVRRNLERMDTHFDPNRLPSFLRYLANFYPWDVTFSDQYYHIRKTYDDITREAIIQLVDVPQIAEFYADLTQELGLSLTPPLTYVTHFLSRTANGQCITIHDQTEFHSTLPIRIHTNADSPSPV